MVRMLERLLGGAAAAVLFLLMVTVLVDVVGRDLFNAPLRGGTELVEVMLAATTFLAYPLLAYQRRHIAVDLFDIFAGGKLRFVGEWLSGLAGALVFGGLGWRLHVLATRSAEYGEGTVELSIPLAAILWMMSGLAWLSAVVFLAVPVSRHAEGEGGA